MIRVQTGVLRPFNEEIVSSTNAAGKTGESHAKEWRCTLPPHHIKIVMKMNKKPKHKSQTYKIS